MQLKVKRSLFGRSPTLGTVLMIEKAIEENSGEFNRTELWKHLPRKVMWQTYLVVLDYLIASNKIIADKDGKIVWIWNPNLVRMLEKRGLLKK